MLSNDLLSMVTSALMVSTSLEDTFGWQANHIEQIIQMMLVFENLNQENRKEISHIDLEQSSDDSFIFRTYVSYGVRRISSTQKRVRCDTGRRVLWNLLNKSNVICFVLVCVRSVLDQKRRCVSAIKFWNTACIVIVREILYSDGIGEERGI